MLVGAIVGGELALHNRAVATLSIAAVLAGCVAAYGFAAVNSASVQPLVGASGAIAGVLGAYIVLYPRARVWSLVPFLFFIPLRIPAWLVLGLWFVLQWVYMRSAPPARVGWPTLRTCSASCSACWSVGWCAWPAPGPTREPGCR